MDNIFPLPWPVSNRHNLTFRCNACFRPPQALHYASALPQTCTDLCGRYQQSWDRAERPFLQDVKIQTAPLSKIAFLEETNQLYLYTLVESYWNKWGKIYSAMNILWREAWSITFKTTAIFLYHNIFLYLFPSLCSRINIASQIYFKSQKTCLETFDVVVFWGYCIFKYLEHWVKFECIFITFMPTISLSLLYILLDAFDGK